MEPFEKNTYFHWTPYLYVFNVDVASNQNGNQPQQWHHGIISVWQSPRIVTIWPSFKLRCKGALTCMCTKLKGKQTLNICPTWRWEAIKGCNQPNHDIMAYFPLDSYPELPKSDPVLAAYCTFDLNWPPPTWGQIHCDSWWANQLILWLQGLVQWLN